MLRRRIVPVLFAAALSGAAACDLLSPCASDPTGPGCAPGEVEGPPQGGAAQLAIAPVMQQTPVWCWAATAEMVFRHYGLPSVNPYGNFQCGIVAAWFGTQGHPQCLGDCGQCPYPVGVMSNQLQVITGYGHFVRNSGGQSRVLAATLVFRALSAAEIRTEIDAGRPVLIGISPGAGFALPNASQHIALLVGYDYTATVPYVVVNDPFPFGLPEYAQQGDPYLAAGGSLLRPGQYRIPLAALVGQLRWANTIYGIH